MYSRLRPRSLHTYWLSVKKSARPMAASFATTASRGSLSPPLNLPKWLNENSHLLKPPINNYCVYSGSATVMVVGGPNARTDYHINSTPEYFYQYKGSMLLKTMDTSTSPPNPQDIPIHEGDMFLLPPNTPHNPVRFSNTVGVVVEQNRPKGELDRLRWYCSDCGDVVAERAFECTDLGTQIKEAVQAFEKDQSARTCKNCGTLCQVRPADVESMRPQPQ